MTENAPYLPVVKQNVVFKTSLFTTLELVFDTSQDRYSNLAPDMLKLTLFTFLT